MQEKFPEVEDFIEELNKIRIGNGEKVKQSRKKVMSVRPKMANEATDMEVNSQSTSETRTSIEKESNPKDTTIVNASRENLEITARLSSNLKAPSFKELMANMSAKDAIIISLRYGSRFGFLERDYSIPEISKFMGLEPEEVIMICRKVLFYFKNELDLFIDTLLSDNKPSL